MRYMFMCVCEQHEKGEGCSPVADLVRLVNDLHLRATRHLQWAISARTSNFSGSRGLRDCHEITMKSPWHHHEITMTSPQENHHCLSSDGVARTWNPLRCNTFWKKRGRWSLLHGAQGEVWRVSCAVEVCSASWEDGGKCWMGSQDDWFCDSQTLQGCCCEAAPWTAWHKRNSQVFWIPYACGWHSAGPTRLRKEAWGQAERSLLIWSSTLDPDSTCGCPFGVFL